MVYVTRGLLEVLVDIAEEADPEGVTLSLAASAAGDLDGADDLSPETPVFTDFYLPDAGRSVSAVFGVDLSTPPGQTHGRFVSHPTGGRSVSLEDDLHAVVFVAIPPWEADTVRAFDRAGIQQEMTVIDAEPPQEQWQ
ncbi:hypothetical protein [Haloarchaeobius sp. HME9146]|uniref:hypothetical protein n=1 Tax=Haloarchaeobius sp. HME9146 TaxID=2978732 RepID=UPI0021BFE1D4|nr:hypothetical protein [Haloarchaeobius sp. HME9146]